MNTDQFTFREKEKLKELEMKYQAAFLNGGYARIALELQSKVEALSENFDAAMEKINSQSGEIGTLHKKLRGRAEEVNSIEEECEQLQDMACKLEAENRALKKLNEEYAESHFMKGKTDEQEVLLQPGEIRIQSNQKVNALFISFTDQELEEIPEEKIEWNE